MVWKVLIVFFALTLLQNPHLSMCGLFTVGQGRQCDLWLKDPAVSNILCKLRHIEVDLPLTSQVKQLNNLGSFFYQLHLGKVANVSSLTKSFVFFMFPRGLNVNFLIYE